MKLTGILLLVTFTCSSYALSLTRGTVDGDIVPIPRADYGELAKTAINNLLTSLAEGGPIPIEFIPELQLNLTEVIGKIIGENKTSPIKGNMVITSPGIGLKPGAVCERASVIVTSIVSPIQLEGDVSIPGVGLVGDYSIDALLLGLIPVRGAGRFYFGADVTAGLTNTSIKPKLASNNGTFPTFEYVYELRGLEVSLEGLIGGPELSEQINAILNNFITKDITPIAQSLAVTLHPLIRALLHDALNEFAKPLTYQMILDLLIPPKPDP